MTTAKHLDSALEHLRAIGHAHEADALTRKQVEFAAAHIRDAWIAHSGQNAPTPEQTHAAMQKFFKLERLAAAMATQPT